MNESDRETPKVWQRPLLQYLALGLVVWGLLWLRSPESGRDSNQVIVEVEQIELLRAQWMSQWRRPPTDEEMAGLIDSWIREEVLYREALALGLDRDDPIVRRRLAQKIELLFQDLATQAEPTRQDLSDFYQRQAERFTDPERRSFRHVYINVDRAGADAERLAIEALERLRSGADPGQVGDRFMMPSGYVLHSEAETGRNFGSGFAEALFELPIGGWQGPVASGYGLHLVEVTDSQEASMPDLADIEDRVRNEYLAEAKRRADEAFYEQVRSKYTVSIEAPAEPEPATSP